MALKITISEEKEVVKVELNGRIDSFSIDELNSGFDTVMKTGKKNILLIMRDLEYINSRGLGALISFLKWVKKVGGLVKIAEVPINIMQVLNILGLDGLTLIYESSTDALESFKRQHVGEEKEHEDDYAAPRPMSDRPVQRQKERRSPLLWVVIIILLLGMMVIFIRENPKGGHEVDLGPLEDKIELLGQRLSRLEDQSRRPMEPTGDEGSSMKKLSRHMGQLAEDLERLKKDVVLSRMNKIQEVQDKSPVSLKPEIRYHQVQPGESLYRIGRRYGISIAELCSLNKIPQTKHIYPGQKLILGHTGGLPAENP
ncbi:MAG: LysM peptidoglycan-binding domain-containing protein [Pseudomonadota bacterium]